MHEWFPGRAIPLQGIQLKGSNDYEEAFKGISHLEIGIVTQMISFVCSLDLCAAEYLTSRLQPSQSQNIQELSMKPV